MRHYDANLNYSLQSQNFEFCVSRPIKVSEIATTVLCSQSFLQNIKKIRLPYLGLQCRLIFCNSTDYKKRRQRLKLTHLKTGFHLTEYTSLYKRLVI